MEKLHFPLRSKRHPSKCNLTINNLIDRVNFPSIIFNQKYQIWLYFCLILISGHFWSFENLGIWIFLEKNIQKLSKISINYFFKLFAKNHVEWITRLRGYFLSNCLSQRRLLMRFISQIKVFAFLSRLLVNF